MTIRILEDHVVNQIAAGEVVERPASVVKELLENALDAGARTVRISLRGGGRSAIRITDDGRGMDRADALMCLERHATSKIRRAEDLEGVATLGFRGEAIPSIAAVSRFQLVTRPHDADVGTKIRVECGRLEDVADAGCAPGTEIDVRSLFAELPARRKFLRTAGTELSHCLEAVVREALTRPDVDFTVTHDDREVLRAPAVGDLAARAEDVLGGWARALHPASFRQGPYEVVGLVSPLGVHRSTASGAMYLYVNGRFVRDAVVRRAVQEAYEERVPRGRYPVVILDLRLDPRLVDVNVHPTKIEVRFHDPRAVGEALVAGLREALDAIGVLRPVDRGPRLPDDDDPVAPTLPLLRPSPPPPPTMPATAPTAPDPSALLYGPTDPPDPTTRTAPVPERRASAGLAAHPDDDPRLLWHRPIRTADDELADLLAAPADVASPALAAEAEPSPWAAEEVEPVAIVGRRLRDLRVIGALGGYVLAEDDGALAVIDVVAAREHVLRHRLLVDPDGVLGVAQRLLAPTLLTLPRARHAALEAHPAVLDHLRLDTSLLGPGELAVRGIPALLKGVPLDRALSDLADALIRHGPDPEGIAGVVARHAAARGEPLDGEIAIRSLLASVDEVEGLPARPIVARIGPDELARRFSRR